MTDKPLTAEWYVEECLRRQIEADKRANFNGSTPEKIRQRISSDRVVEIELFNMALAQGAAEERKRLLKTKESGDE